MFGHVQADGCVRFPFLGLASLFLAFDFTASFLTSLRADVRSSVPTDKTFVFSSAWCRGRCSEPSGTFITLSLRAISHPVSGYVRFGGLDRLGFQKVTFTRGIKITKNSTSRRQSQPSSQPGTSLPGKNLFSRHLPEIVHIHVCVYGTTSHTHAVWGVSLPRGLWESEGRR